MELSSNRSVDAKSGKGQSTIVAEVASITRLLSVLPPLWVIIIGVVVVVESFIEYFLCDYIDVWYIFFSEHFTIPASTTPPTRPTSHDTTTTTTTTCMYEDHNLLSATTSDPRRSLASSFNSAIVEARWGWSISGTSIPSTISTWPGKPPLTRRQGKLTTSPEGMLRLSW